MTIYCKLKLLLERIAASCSTIGRRLPYKICINHKAWAMLDQKPSINNLIQHHVGK